MNLVDGNNWYWRSEDPLLSVLILTLPSRSAMLSKLLAVFDAQKNEHVEIIINSDNRVKKVGAKRQEALEASKGEYVAFVDDDDLISRHYVDQLVKATRFGADVITFDQQAIIDRSPPFKVVFSIKHPVNEQLRRRPGGGYFDIKRRPFHMCAWRGEIARRHSFKPISWAEDWAWCASMLVKDVKTEYRVEEVLHYYEYNRDVSECSPTKR